MTEMDTDRQSRLVWAVLAILGAVLAVVGWYSYVQLFFSPALSSQNHGLELRTGNS
jgi:hypothetical protein